MALPLSRPALARRGESWRATLPAVLAEFAEALFVFGLILGALALGAAAPTLIALFLMQGPW